MLSREWVPTFQQIFEKRGMLSPSFFTMQQIYEPNFERGFPFGSLLFSLVIRANIPTFFYRMWL